MIAIIDYGAGNIRSVQNALHRLGVESIVTSDPEIIRSSEKVIFPGVGEARTAMAFLSEKALDVLIPTLTQPVLGICLGLQLLCTSSEEGNTACLGIFNTKVRRFHSDQIVPHMGWNNCDELQSELFNGIAIQDDFYFVHSYYAELCEETIAVGNYGFPFSAALKKNNFYATQFHPEKSAGVGERILQNFINL